MPSLFPSNVGKPGRNGLVPARGCGQTTLESCEDLFSYAENQLNPSDASWVYNIPEFVEDGTVCTDCFNDITQNGVVSGYNVAGTSWCSSSAPHQWGRTLDEDYVPLDSCATIGGGNISGWHTPIVTLDCLDLLGGSFIVIELCLAIGFDSVFTFATRLSQAAEYRWSAQIPFPQAPNVLFGGVIELDSFVPPGGSVSGGSRCYPHWFPTGGAPQSAFVTFSP